MTIRIAFPYRLRHGQRNSGLLPGAPGRVRAWVAVKTKAWSPQFRRWRRVLVTKYIEVGVNAVGSQCLITPLDPPYEYF